MPFQTVLYLNLQWEIPRNYLDCSKISLKIRLECFALIKSFKKFCSIPIVWSIKTVTKFSIINKIKDYSRSWPVYRERTGSDWSWSGFCSYSFIPTKELRLVTFHTEVSLQKLNIYTFWSLTHKAPRVFWGRNCEKLPLFRIVRIFF